MMRKKNPTAGHSIFHSDGGGRVMKVFSSTVLITVSYIRLQVWYGTIPYRFIHTHTYIHMYVQYCTDGGDDVDLM